APIAIVEGETTPLGPACALWLLDQPPRDRPTSPSGLDFEGVLEDSIEEFVFADQAEVARLEQQRFERNLEQIERYIEDQLLVLRRHLSTPRPVYEPRKTSEMRLWAPMHERRRKKEYAR